MRRSSGSEIPEQAVLLCGGRGERLRPLTDQLPKPMVDVNGVPFMEHLMRQLSLAGLERFLLLTGYLGEQIKEYFGDGRRFGWAIEYSHGTVDWPTGRRLIEAGPLLDPMFLLTYADNYAQIDLSVAIEVWQKLDPTVAVHMARKSPGNLLVDETGLVISYDCDRKMSGMTHVDVGYGLANRDKLLESLASLPTAPNCDFSDGLARLASMGNLAAVGIHGTYHSVSDLDRLEETRSYLRRKPLLLLDRDGTINKRMPVGEYVTHWDQFELIPETTAALADLAERGFHFAVLTNQAGVARGMIEPDELDRIHKLMVEELAGLGVPVDAVYVCTDHWLDGSYYRKPEPGMLFEASSEAGTASEMLVFVGDDSRDLEAATRAGCGFVYISDTPEKVEFPKSRQLRVAVNKLTQAVEPICTFYGLEAPR